MSTSIAPLDVTILASGGNFLNISTIVALALNGYDSMLPKGSTFSIATMNPGVAAMQGPRLVGERKFDLGITTPAWLCSAALEGRAPYSSPQPLRGVALFPHDDRMVVLVRRDTGLTSIADIVKQKFPLRYAMPGSDEHPAILVMDAILQAYGTSRAEIDSWGGRRIFDRPGLLHEAASNPEKDEWQAIFDEAIMTPGWQFITQQHDVAFLPIDEPVLTQLEQQGMKRGKIEKERFSQLKADVPTIDLSWWFMYCHADLDDDVTYSIAKIVDKRPTAFQIPILLEHGLTSAPNQCEALSQMPVPLHPGAMRYYKERGYL